MRRIWKFFSQSFDRAFSRGNVWQFVWLIGFIVFFLLSFWGLSALPSLRVGRATDSAPWFIRILELIMDPGAFVGSYNYGEHYKNWVTAFQFLVTITGAIFFTSFMINSIGNWLDRKVEDVAKGRRTYLFDDHIVFFGANAMLETILKSLTADINHQSCDFVIVTDGDIDKVRGHIYSQLPEQFYRNVYLICGNRTEAKGMEELHLKRARSIYILGEDAESFHDAKNLECWNLLRAHCTATARPINCYLVLDRASSVRSFLYKEGGESTESLNLTLINAVENLAQRVFVSRGFEENESYPSLDGEGISADSDKQVHLVVFGMTQVAYAMATTAAHICHFPNFKKGIRTKITFIAEGLQQEMDYFCGRYSNLMELSYSKYISPNGDGKSTVRESFPKRKYLGTSYKDRKGYLDIEWEFIDAGIETSFVRNYLVKCAGRHDSGLEQLTLALCENDPEGNVAASMCLPAEIYDSHIPVLAYQPFSGEVLKFAHDSGHYRNIYPFGLKVDCFDPWLQTRLMRARRIKHVYDMKRAGKKIVVMPDDEKLLKLTAWFSTSYSHQLSNLYASNSLETKLRSIRPGCDSVTGSLTDVEIAVIAEIEHNRWNVERLLCGMRAMPKDIRTELRKGLKSDDLEIKKAAEIKAEEWKSDFSVHYNIVPYEELFDEDKEYNISIAKNIPLVLKNQQVVSYMFKE